MLAGIYRYNGWLQIIASINYKQTICLNYRLSAILAQDHNGEFRTTNKKKYLSLIEVLIISAVSLPDLLD